MNPLTKHFIAGALFLFSAAISLFAQTPGMIFEPATGGGAAVLDPNGDGYVSQNTGGFLVDDQAESEIPFNSLVFPEIEPTSDLSAGPNCSFTDFVDEGDEDPVQSYLDASNNWLFRMRMGRAIFNAKSYSILVDTDGLFGNTGPNADPDFTNDNPGFEIEIVLATKFGVFVYDVNTATPTCTPVLSYPGTTNYQKSIALTTNCGDPDYFYDFFVSFPDLTSQFGITPATPMRMAIVDNMAAMKSTVCNPNSASDIAGVNDGNCGSLAECLTYVIDNYPPCPASAINGGTCTDRSRCPSITGPVDNGATSVSGTSTEADGTLIEVFKNGISIGTTTVTGGNWTLAGISPALVSNDTINATATAPGETPSEDICNTTIVGSVCTDPPSNISQCNARKAIQGIAPPGAVINLYQANSTVPLTPTSGYNFAGGVVTAGTLPSTLTPTTDNWLWKCAGSGQSSSCTAGGGPCLNDGAHRVTATEPGKCESEPVWICVNGASPTAAASVTTTPITTATTSISGTVAAPDNVAGVVVYVYINRREVANVTTGAGGTWTASGLTFNSCDTLTVRALNVASMLCIGPLSADIVISGGQSDPPVILGNYCTATTITSVFGTSTEPDGTIIQVFENGVAEGASTTVTNGVWVANTGISIAPGNTITATALNNSTCETESAPSTGVVVGASTVDALLAITSAPITEGDASVSGTGTNGNSIQLYIDGFPIGAPVVVAGGIWTVTGLSNEIYSTGEVTATSTAPGGCASGAAGPVTVICIPANLTLAVDPPDTTICTGSVAANVRILGSQPGIIYQLTDNGVNSGSSGLGNGGILTLTSDTLTDTTVLRVKAVKIPIGTCTDTLLDSVVVNVNAIPDPGLVVSLSANPICTGDSSIVQVAISQNNFTYQLRRVSDNAAIGPPVAGTGGNIGISTGPLTATTQFYIQVQGVFPSFCEDTLSARPTVNVNNMTSPVAGPDQGIACTNSATLAGNSITFGTGSWNVISGTGSVTTPADPASGVTGIGPGPLELEWVVTTAGCAARHDTVIITRNNCPPVVDNETLTITEGTSGGGDLTDAGDSDFDGTTLTANTTPVSGPGNGGIVINPNGTYTYTPNPGFVGRDTIVVEICDAGLPLPGLCTNDTVFVLVQGDKDGDGIVDAIDIDDDNDGIPDVVEAGGLDPDLDLDGDDIPDWRDSSAPGFTDSNGDGVDDRFDADMDGIPNHFDIDADNDGVADAIEANGGVPPANYDNGTGMFTGPVGANGMPDNAETAPESGISNLPIPNTDGTGLPDYLDIDSDDDGIPDMRETQPTVGFITPSGTDADGNGRDDAFDGVNAVTPVNTDGTGQPDYLDLDSDDDGVPDFIEGHDADMNGIPDVTPLGTDSDGDGLDDAYDTLPVTSTNNALGSNAPLQDTDGDAGSIGGDRDWRDTDDDNDGIPTNSEDFNTNTNWADDFTQGGGTTPDYLFAGSFPVTWLGFEGELVNQDSWLQWATASESNSSHFEVERSADGLGFQSVGSVPAAGNSADERQYQFIDPSVVNLGARLLYYRLRQVDQTGGFSYSEVVTIGISSEGQGIGGVYPVPAEDFLNVDFALRNSGTVKIDLINMWGQVFPLYQSGQELDAGWHQQRLDISRFSAGSYILLMRTGTDIYRKKIEIIGF